MHTRAIDGDLELMRVFETAHRTEIGAEEARLDHVLAIERQRRVREHPADRADRQPFDVPVLRRILPHAERFARHAAVGIADRKRAHLSRSREIALEQHG